MFVRSKSFCKKKINQLEIFLITSISYTTNSFLRKFMYFSYWQYIYKFSYLYISLRFRISQVEHLVKTGTTLKMFFYSRDISFQSFSRVLVPDFGIIAIQTKSTQLAYRILSRTRKPFFSKAVCHPDCSYYIDQENSRLILLCKNDTQEVRR